MRMQREFLFLMFLPLSLYVVLVDNEVFYYCFYVSE